MPKNMIMQELNSRIERLKEIEIHSTTEEEKKVLESRRRELESMKSFVDELVGMGVTDIDELTNHHEFWRLVDEF